MIKSWCNRTWNEIQYVLIQETVFVIQLRLLATIIISRLSVVYYFLYAHKENYNIKSVTIK